MPALQQAFFTRASPRMSRIAPLTTGRPLSSTRPRDATEDTKVDVVLHDHDRNAAALQLADHLLKVNKFGSR